MSAFRKKLRIGGMREGGASIFLGSLADSIPRLSRKSAYCHACVVASRASTRRLDHLKPENRKLVEMTAMRRRLLQDTLHAARVSYRESQALVARSRGKLYLAADHGQKTIRDWN
jgi:hypothetical protein